MDLLLGAVTSLWDIDSLGLSYCSVMRNDYLNATENLGLKDGVNKNYYEKFIPTISL